MLEYIKTKITEINTGHRNKYQNFAESIMVVLSCGYDVVLICCAACHIYYRKSDHAIYRSFDNI